MKRESDGWLADGSESRPIDRRLASFDDPERYEHLVEHVQDALVEFELVDEEPIVRAVNPAFVDVFGYEAEAIVGESLNAFIVPPWLEAEARRLDEQTEAGEVNYRHVTRETDAGLREFLYRSIPYETTDGAQGGFALYTELTEDRRKQSRIEVLHRLLRHNLRNELGVLVGTLEEVVERVDDGDTLRLVQRARESATDLESLAEEAHEIQRTLDAPVPANAEVDCVDIATGVVDRMRSEYPAATVTLETTAPAPAAATERLAVAIEELVTNAIVHNSSEEPRVWVSVGPAPEAAWTDIVVAGDGPRIPEADRSVVTGGAEITSMRHGSGLGLWLVAWTVEGFGGTVSFGERDGDGNEVRLRLPR
jgi:PAS domain S-box-containing protein